MIITFSIYEEVCCCYNLFKLLERRIVILLVQSSMRYLGSVVGKDAGRNKVETVSVAVAHHLS